MRPAPVGRLRGDCGGTAHEFDEGRPPQGASRPEPKTLAPVQSKSGERRY
jgi:hypothetical protein